MNLLADESVDRQIVARLRQEGHKVWYVGEMEPGIADNLVLDLANREGALLLNADKDFGELVFRQHRVSSGILLIRLSGLSPVTKAEIVALAVRKHSGKLAQGFAVLTPKTIRIRHIGR